jgi:hypothetical protein
VATPVWPILLHLIQVYPAGDHVPTQFGSPGSCPCPEVD